MTGSVRYPDAPDRPAKTELHGSGPPGASSNPGLPQDQVTPQVQPDNAALFPPFVRLHYRDRLELVNLVLKGSTDYPHYRGCFREVVDLYQELYWGLQCKVLVKGLTGAGADKEVVAELLARKKEHVNEQFAGRRPFTGEQVAFLKCAYPKAADMTHIFSKQCLPRIQTLIEVEDWFRNDWLPRIAPGSPAAARPATLAEATVMSAYCCEQQYMDDVRGFAIAFHSDIYQAAANVTFRRLLRAILDNALLLAADDPVLADEFRAFPCPLKDCRPFLRFFAATLKDRCFSWLIVCVANDSQLHPTT